jgi:single-stranded-DNA-specific exonuclease
MNYHIKREILENDKLTPDEIVALLLKDRGIENVSLFLTPPKLSEITLEDFFKDHSQYKKNIEKVTTLLTDIKRENKMIVVYTDYDADGITGGTIVWETLHLLGFNVMPYVPDRKLEGYGFSRVGIDKVKKEFNPALIISVDHGISASDKITYAKTLRIPVIVTDHHMKSDTNPDDALAIFHIDKLSGSGVGYFFAKELFSFFQKDAKNKDKLTKHFNNDYASLASIGTIADLVPLVGQSRSLVKEGLRVFNNCLRPGIRHLLKEAHLGDRTITPYEIGYVIAPRINAVGRLSNAIDALRLLCTTNDEQAALLAKTVGGHNKDRQDLVKKAVEEAKKLVLTKPNNEKIIILTSTEISDTDSYWNEGIIGLIASKMVEEFYKPTIVMTKSDGFLKASARSVKGFDITSFLRSLKNYLVDVGGHTQAAGFTIQKENLEEFISEAQKKALGEVTDSMLQRSIDIDFKIPLSKVTLNLAKKLEELQPFGMGNPQPLFMSAVKILDVKFLGKQNEHLKLLVRDAEKPSYPMEMIGFSMGAKYFEFTKDKICDLIYKLEINRWGGKEIVKGIIVVKGAH